MNGTDGAMAQRPPTGSRAVAIGGGHGLARALAALPSVVEQVTAVVTVADDGGSSGRLRRDLDILPLGDLRMALTSLAPSTLLAELVGYRFPRGELAGHSLGNLMLVALQERSGGDVTRALDDLAGLLQVPGRVLPCTTEQVGLFAATGAGAVSGQAAVAATPRLERVWLEPADPEGHPEVVSAIEQADLITLGPGSLYTSLLPNLLVPDVARAVVAATVPVVLIANLRQQPGETEGMSLIDHLDALQQHVPGIRIDALILHDGPAPRGSGAPLTGTDEELAPWVGRTLRANLLDGRDGHAPKILAELLRGVLTLP